MKSRYKFESASIWNTKKHPTHKKKKISLWKGVEILHFTCFFYILRFTFKFRVLAKKMMGSVKMKAVGWGCENEMLLGYKIKRMKGYCTEVW